MVKISRKQVRIIITGRLVEKFEKDEKQLVQIVPTFHCGSYLRNTHIPSGFIIEAMRTQIFDESGETLEEDSSSYEQIELPPKYRDDLEG